jgi:hypothetical protein
MLRISYVSLYCITFTLVKILSNIIIAIVTSFIIDEAVAECTVILLIVSVPHCTRVEIKEIQRLPERVWG